MVENSTTVVDDILVKLKATTFPKALYHFIHKQENLLIRQGFLSEIMSFMMQSGLFVFEVISLYISTI